MEGDNVGGGGTGTGFHNIDELPLGKLLRVKYLGGKSRPGERHPRGPIHKLRMKGFSNLSTPKLG